jgi:hypothetical protein
VTAPTLDDVTAEIEAYTAGQVAAAEAPLLAQVAQLEQQLAADQHAMEFGAYNAVGGDTAAALAALVGPSGLGKVVRRRSFSTGLVPWAKHSASGDAAAGLTSFASVKPPTVNGAYDIPGVITGTYDARIDGFVGPAPAGSLLTMLHEPENNTTADEFAPMIKHFGDLCDMEHEVGYVAMEYQWSAAGNGNWVGYSKLDPADLGVDFLAIDVYGLYFNIGPAAGTPLVKMQGFSRWYQWAQSTGLPLRVAELGIMRTGQDNAGAVHTFTDQQRADWLDDALSFLTTAGFVSVSYWHSDTGNANQRTYGLTGPGVPPAPLALAAWTGRQ